MLLVEVRGCCWERTEDAGRTDDAGKRGQSMLQIEDKVSIWEIQRMLLREVRGRFWESEKMLHDGGRVCCMTEDAAGRGQRMLLGEDRGCF